MSKVEGIKYSFLKDRWIVVIAYLMAVAGAWVSMQLFLDQEILIRLAIGDITATVIVFIFSMVFRNSSMYDPYWSVIPIIILLYLFYAMDVATISLRMVLVSIVVGYWGIRLTVNWLRTWPGLGHEDWRYVKLANDTGPFYWVVSFLGIHLIPTVVVFLGCLPLFPILTSDAPIAWTDFAGFLVALVAVEIERRADNQLREFKVSNDKSSGSVCEQGLWKYSRHPNYFGEISFWAGLFIIAYGLNPSENLSYGIGLLAMIILFVFISIPMMEKRQQRKQAYKDYKKRVSMLIPWFRKN